MASYSGTHYVPGMNDLQARAAARLEIPVLVATLLTIPFLILVFQDGSGALRTIGDVLNWVIWLVFLFEAIVMIRISPDDVAYLKRNPLDVAILLLTPPFLPEALHFLWVLRLLRIIDLMPLIGRIFRYGQFRYAATLAFVVVFGGGIAYAEIEEGRGVTEWDGVWWAMTTISTVGYGDQFPTSPGGRVLGMMVMLMGPILIGLVASGVTSKLTREIREDLLESREDIAEIEEDLDELEEDVEGLTSVDRMVLARLEEIGRRLEALEKPS